MKLHRIAATTVGMAHDTDACKVDSGQMRERLPAISRDISMERQWLALGCACLGLPRIAPWCADIQRHEAAARQLQAEVAPSLFAQADTGLRFVIDDEHGRERALTLGHQQPAFAGLIGGDLQSDATLGELLPPRLREHFQVRSLEQRGPGAH